MGIERILARFSLLPSGEKVAEGRLRGEVSQHALTAPLNSAIWHRQWSRVPSPPWGEGQGEGRPT
jgi:hypothetical protein